MHDQLQRFMFDGTAVRGKLVRLDRSWRDVLAQHDYPSGVRQQLGQALAAVLLLSATIKFKGSLILQAQGDGPLQTLVAHATDEKCVRGVARWRDAVPEGSLPQVFGSGRLALTVQTEGAEPYQGIVPLEGQNLAAAIEAYFERSEQIPTRLWLAANEGVAAGLFLQQLPSPHVALGDWQRLTTLAETITPDELLNHAGSPLLQRLFGLERARVFEPETVRFRCNCSQERLAKLLTALGPTSLESLLTDQGQIEVRCEFCNRLYRFDADALIGRNSPTPGTERFH